MCQNWYRYNSGNYTSKWIAEKQTIIDRYYQIREYLFICFDKHCIRTVLMTRKPSFDVVLTILATVFFLRP